MFCFYLGIYNRLLCELPELETSTIGLKLE